MAVVSFIRSSSDKLRRQRAWLRRRTAQLRRRAGRPGEVVAAVGGEELFQQPLGAHVFHVHRLACRQRQLDGARRLVLALEAVVYQGDETSRDYHTARG